MMARFIYVAVKEREKERLLGAYSRLNHAYDALKEQTDVRPLSYVRQAFKNGQPYALLGVANQTLYKLYRFEER
jgi:hypothetical protein